MKLIPLSREEVLNAIDYRMQYSRSGLCWSFSKGNPGKYYYDSIPAFLTKIGGCAYNEDFWPRSTEAEDERLMMLAFMLIWAEDNDDHAN